MTPQSEAYLDRLWTEFPFYAEEILRIKTKTEGIQPFRLNKAQLHIHAAIEDQLRRKGKVRKVLLKGRQQGGSTYVEGRFYGKVSRKYGQSAKILTHLGEATTNLFNMTRRFHELTPDAFRPQTNKNSTQYLDFTQLKSEFSVSTAGSTGTGRSATAQFFHGSEVAFWPNAEDHMTGIGQIVPNAAGTEIILESTANGVGNYFHNAVENAIAGEGEYELIFVPWLWQPEYAITPPSPDWKPDAEGEEYGELYSATREQLYWRHLKIKDEFGAGGSSMFDQEYPATIALAFRRVQGDTFIPIEWVERAMKQLQALGMGPKILGLDPAEYGPDSSVFLGRQGRNARLFYKRFNGIGQMALAGHAARIMEQGEYDCINIDVTGGYGGGVADRLIELGFNVNRINFGEKAIEDDKYPRRMDEMWGAMRGWLEQGPVALPDDPKLQMELTMRQFSYDSQRRTLLESKEKMRRRGLKSPDGADALALTFAMPVRQKKKPPRVHAFQGGSIGY